MEGTTEYLFDIRGDTGFFDYSKRIKNLMLVIATTFWIAFSKAHL